MGAKDGDYGSKGPGGQQEDSATVQMAPDELDELHRQLAKIGEAGPKPRSFPAPPPRQMEFSEAETMVPEDAEEPYEEPYEEPAPAPAPPPRRAAPAAPPRPAAAPRAPAPVRPLPAAAPRASGAQIAGGVGALLLAVALILLFPPIAQELPREEVLGYALVGAAALGYALVAVGLSASSRLTNAFGGIAAIFAYLTVLGYIAQLAVVGELRGDTQQLAKIIIFFLPWATWLFIGLWGLISSRVLGAAGVLAGVFGLLCGLAGIGMGVMRVARVGDRDLFEALAYGANGGAVLAAVLVGVTLLSGVREDV